MKKSIFVTLLLLVASVGVTMAQEQETTYYGGKKGDWSASFNVVSLSVNPILSAGYMLSDRWMLDAEMEFNAEGLMGEYSSVYTNVSASNLSYDRDFKHHTIDAAVGVKYLLFPGERVQAYVGGRLCMESYYYYTKTDYDESISNSADTKTITDTVDFGVSLTFGADYFITPRMAIGGRFSLGALIGSDVYDSYTSNTNNESVNTGRTEHNWIFRSNDNCILLSFYF